MRSPKAIIKDIASKTVMGITSLAGANRRTPSVSLAIIAYIVCKEKICSQKSPAFAGLFYSSSSFPMIFKI